MTSASHHFASVSCRIGLAGAEAAGDRRLPAARNREQCVEDALAGDHRLVGGKPRGDRPRLAHRPVMEEADVVAFAVRVADGAQQCVALRMRLRPTMFSTVPPMFGGSRQSCFTPSPGNSPIAVPAFERVAGFDQRPKRDFAVCPHPHRAGATGRRRYGRAGRAQAAPTARRRGRARHRRGAGRWCPRRPGRPIRRP